MIAEANDTNSYVDMVQALTARTLVKLMKLIRGSSTKQQTYTDKGIFNAHREGRGDGVSQ